MATYSYKATDSAGKIVTGVLEADEEKKVVAELQTRGLIPIRIALAKGNGKRLGLNVSEQFLGLFHGVSSKDVMVFTQDLATLLEAGLPVDRALSLLIESAEKERFKMVANDILKTVQGGGYLSDALAKHPKAFTSFLCQHGAGRRSGRCSGSGIESTGGISGKRTGTQGLY